MPKVKKNPAPAGATTANVGYEAQLWKYCAPPASIATTYDAWRDTFASLLPKREGQGDGRVYADIAGFCKSAPLDEFRKHGHVLTPGRYVGAEAVVDDGEPFAENMRRLTATLRGQQGETTKLDAAITANLKKLGYVG